MNKVMLVGRLTRDPELRSLPSGKHVSTFTIATNEYRGGGNAERTEYHPCVACVPCRVDAILALGGLFRRDRELSTFARGRRREPHRGL